MTYSSSLLPLFGVALGWGLKALSDYLFSRKQDVRTFRKATFYLLSSYKSLYDYDRATTYFRLKKPSVADFEPWRKVAETHFFRESEANSATLSRVVELLASVDPTLAAHVHNSLKRIARAFERDLGTVAEQDPKVYVGLVDTQDQLVATTLNDLQNATISAAKNSGIGMRRKVKIWFDERAEGETDFQQGMDEQKDLREKASSISH